MNYLWVAIGSALGGVARYWCSGLVARLAGETFPWGTIRVNILGSFVIGFAAALSRPEGRFLIPFEARLFIMVGLCGGYMTFSSFSAGQRVQVNGLAGQGGPGDRDGPSLRVCVGS